MTILFKLPKKNEDFDCEKWIKVDEPIKNKTLYYAVAIGIGVILMDLLRYFFNIYIDFEFSLYKRLYLLLLIIPIHELLHLVSLKNPLKSTICILPKQFLVCVIPEEAICNRRFLIMLITPFVILTIIPIILLIFLGVNSTTIAYIALYNALCCGADILSFFSLSKFPGKSMLKLDVDILYIKRDLGDE